MHGTSGGGGDNNDGVNEGDGRRRGGGGGDKGEEATRGEEDHTHTYEHLLVGWLVDFASAGAGRNGTAPCLQATGS